MKKLVIAALALLSAGSAAYAAAPEAVNKAIAACCDCGSCDMPDCDMPCCDHART
ncbi:hypothetical protein SCH01S_29_00940 [Sphingomonas changbaiensis NBRC 104936]|uniref:Uncharacterized protein n=1 Tax=Sphingomonas changbaiensis NBRC 104936 TaxID=1219043 RepID=A0A0E9MPQ8_9SPHN|nr:hypothetical protein [Sphingomonas changbaiensis]GAO39406.1 hypothetical protein SCH01S_29_00940 [Sphingomonas changbaiensis NBRC 104936]